MSSIYPPHHPHALTAASTALQNNGVIIYPTDTLYALGADATNPNAVEKIYDIKQRSHEKALSVCVGNIDDIEKYALLTHCAHKLARAFLPGALTIILECTNALARNISSDETIAMRIPDHPFISMLYAHTNTPITATSANISEHETAAHIADIESQLKTKNVDCIIDAGELYGAPSTIVDCRKKQPHIVREGAISRHAIEKALKMRYIT